MSDDTKQEQAIAPTDYETPTVTEVGDAGKVILGTGSWKLDADDSTQLE
jgi:hypothetical protein